MKRIFTVFAIVSIANICLAQSLETETRIVDSFIGIKVSSGINLYLTQDKEHKVIVEAGNKYINDVNTKVINGILNISMASNVKIRINSTINVYVTISWIESLDVSSAADVYCKERLKLEKLTVKNSSGSDTRLDIECRDLTLYSSSGSDIKAKGSTLNLIAKASSGSDINTKELEAINASLEASSGSDIIAYVLGEIDANASSGSDITYYGNALPKTLKQSGGSDIRKR